MNDFPADRSCCSRHYIMMRIAIIMIISSVAYADAPHGHYQVAAEPGWQPVYGQDKMKRPSCDRRARDFIANIGALNISVARTVRVNGTIWEPGPHTNQAISIVNDKLLEGFIVQITIYRVKDVANGVILIIGRSDGVNQCGDGLRLRGELRALDGMPIS